MWKRKKVNDSTNNHQMRFTISLSVLLQYASDGEISRHFLSELGALFCGFLGLGDFLSNFHWDLLWIVSSLSQHRGFLQNYYEMVFFPLLKLKKLLYFKERDNRPSFLKMLLLGPLTPFLNYGGFCLYVLYWSIFSILIKLVIWKKYLYIELQK